MGEPGGLPSMGSHRVGHDWNDLAAVAVLSNTNTKLFRFFYNFIKQYDVCWGDIFSLFIFSKIPK